MGRGQDATVERWMMTDDGRGGCARGASTSAAAIVGVGHTHASFAAKDHAHAATGKHKHARIAYWLELGPAGRVVLYQAFRRPIGTRALPFVSDYGHFFIGSNLRAFGEAGLFIAEQKGDRGIRVINDGKVYIGPDIQATTPLSARHVGGDLTLKMGKVRDRPAPGVIKRHATTDNRIFAILPDGTIKQVFLA